MSLNSLISQGDKLLEEKDFLEAIVVFTKAIDDNPKAFSPYLKRATAYQKVANYDAAKRDISIAHSIAHERGKRSDKGVCYYRLGLVYYLEKKFKSALKQFEKATEYDCQEPTLAIWKRKAENDIKAGKGVDEDDEDLTATSGTEEIKEESKEKASPKVESVPVEKKQPVVEKSTDPEVIAKHAPLKQKIREDWYQSNDTVTITIYAKNVKKDVFSIQFETRSVSISFPSADNSEYNYHLEPLGGDINAEQSSYRIFGTKVEVYLKKASNEKWPSLEGAANTSSAAGTDAGLSYPSSSKKAIDWANFNVDDDDDGKADEADFFSKLYKDVDEDTKRAMMKSYVQSNGTVLTTNWNEAKDKEFETSPPEGMEARKWT